MEDWFWKTTVFVWVLVNKGWYGMLLPDVLWRSANARNVSYSGSYSPNRELLGEKHTISTFFDQNPFYIYELNSYLNSGENEYN